MLNLSRNLGLVSGASVMGTVFMVASGANDITADIERRRAVPGCGRAFADNRDLPAGEADIDKTPVGDAAVGQKRFDLAHAPSHELFAIATCYAFWSLAPAPGLQMNSGR